MEKSDFCGHQFGVQKPQQKPVSPQRASQFKSMCGHTCLQGVANNCSWRCQNHGNPAVCKTCRVPAETIETCTILPGGKNFADKTTPVLGSVLDTKTGAKSPGHKQIKLRLNEWAPFWGPFLDPKTGFVLSAKLLSPSEKQHKFRLFLHVRDRSFPYRWLSRALQPPRVLVLHTLRTFMSTHVLELGRPSVATPVLLVFSGPKMKATNSPENAINFGHINGQTHAEAFVKNG